MYKLGYNDLWKHALQSDGFVPKPVSTHLHNKPSKTLHLPIKLNQHPY